MKEYKPLTPGFRRDILDSLDAQMRELNACQNTAFVVTQKIGLSALENLFRALPDGYPVPIERD